MPILLRLTLSVLFLAFAFLCGFGFLASFEDPGSLAFRIFYGLLVMANFASIFTVWRPRRTTQGV